MAGGRPEKELVVYLVLAACALLIALAVVINVRHGPADLSEARSGPRRP